MYGQPPNYHFSQEIVFRDTNMILGSTNVEGWKYSSNVVLLKFNLNIWRKTIDDYN
jgi:hypothetical protein